MSGLIERIKLKAKAAEGGNNQVNDNEFLDTSIKVEATDKGCGENEINLVICLDGCKQIAMEERKGKKVHQLRCRMVKLVERNDDDKQVCVEHKWDARRKKCSTPNPESKIPHTPVTVNEGKVQLTPATNTKKRKHGSLTKIKKTLLCIQPTAKARGSMNHQKL